MNFVYSLVSKSRQRPVGFGVRNQTKSAAESISYRSPSAHPLAPPTHPYRAQEPGASAVDAISKYSQLQCAIDLSTPHPTRAEISLTSTTAKIEPPCYYFIYLGILITFKLLNKLENKENIFLKNTRFYFKMHLKK